MSGRDLTLYQEGARLFRICNSCRYCEGFCAVYPAMERRTSFPAVDLEFLGNVCHNCGECYYACQYAPPHEFGVNMPQLLARLRVASYEKYAWPQVFARAYRANGVVLSLVLVAALSVALGLVPGAAVGPGDFYAVLPHAVMAGFFSAVGLFVVLALAVGGVRFWRATGMRGVSGAAVTTGLREAFTLHYLGEDEEKSLARKRLHQLTFYGFLVCFASTCVAAFYDYAMGWVAPYGYFSVPVVLGVAGGVALTVGTAGQFWLKVKRTREVQDAAQGGMDAGFILLLLLTAVTGLMLEGLRESGAMPRLLAVHLAAVFALFVTMPYGKFVHGIYRTLALVRNAAERDSGRKI